MSFNSPGRGSSPRASSVSAFGGGNFASPLRSKSVAELEPLDLPSPPPPLREGVTEVHYSRWVVEVRLARSASLAACVAAAQWRSLPRARSL